MPAKKLRGRKPNDLPELAATWKNWPLAKRITTARGIPGYTSIELQSAVAITLNEQPGRISVGNCCGIMCWGDTRPWGWTRTAWAAGEPVGYALIPEGAGGMLGCFLAFDSVTDSLAFRVGTVRRRGIVSAEACADNWVKTASLHSKSIAGFTRALARVQAAWDADGEAPRPVLRRGISGDAVIRLQELLTAHGFRVAADGSFGPKTEQAAKRFQSEHKDQDGRPLTADGIVGAKTWWALTRQ